MAFVDSDEAILTTDGVCSGVIGTAMQGAADGYDCLFYIPELGKTMAEISKVEKNAISHRGQALKNIASKSRLFKMRIGVISDTHGDLATILQVVNQITDVDLWLHAGDCSQDADYLRGLVKVPVVAARGNCDGHTTAKIDEFVEVADRKIWLTHGHRYGVKQGTQELVRGKHYGADVVVYGHTHIVDNRPV